MNFKELLGVITLSPHKRIRRHIEYLIHKIEIKDKKDRDSFDNILESFFYAERNVTNWVLLKTIVFVLFWITTIAAVGSSLIPGVSTLISPFVQVANFIGFAVLGVILLILNKIIQIIRIDMLVQHSHLVAIASRHGKRMEFEPKYHFGIFLRYK